MIGDTPFEISMSWEIEDGVTLPLRVFGTLTAFVPEIPATFNDPGSPAEGGELEDVKIMSRHRLTPEQEAELLADDAFVEAVRRRL